MTIAILTRLIAILLAALCAPAGSCARVRGFGAVQLFVFAYGLAEMCANGEKLRYPGESLATVAARIDLYAWIAFDPPAAARHLARRATGWRRARMGKRAPLSFAPARLWLAACVAAPARLALDDTS
ncbi:MAG: hypothetical protein NW200_02280 [Hyphomonadaceae bacterium]|nr:hypothetical protein [Hyphomonadaceae bacterium]